MHGVLKKWQSKELFLTLETHFINYMFFLEKKKKKNHLV